MPVALDAGERRRKTREKLAHATDASNDSWRTPRPLYKTLDDEFHFEWDLASSHENHLAPRYFTVEDNTLAQNDWVGVGFCNPPYSREGGGKKAWVEWAHHAAQRGATVVMLVPATTDQGWFHDIVLGRYEVRFVRGRVKFLQADGTPAAGATFASMIVVFRTRYLASLETPPG